MGYGRGCTFGEGEVKEGMLEKEAVENDLHGCV